MKNSLIKYMASYSVTIKCSTMLLVNSKVLYRRKKQNLSEEECIGGAAGCQEGRWCSLHAAHPEMQDSGQYTRMVPKPHFFFCKLHDPSSANLQLWLWTSFYLVNLMTWLKLKNDRATCTLWKQLHLWAETQSVCARRSGFFLQQVVSESKP